MSAYRVWVRVRSFSEDEWGRAIDAIAAKAGHAAALLDGELAPEIVDDLEGAGLALLPARRGRHHLHLPDWANPCKHAAAVCYLIAELLDRDPFTVLQLRGRGRDEVLAGLRARRATAAATAPDRPPRTPTRPARSLVGRATGPLPRPPLPPARAGRPALLLADPARVFHLRRRAGGAGRRRGEAALQLATGDSDGGLSSSEQDLARRAEALIGTPAFGALAGRAGLTEKHLLPGWRWRGAMAALAGWLSSLTSRTRPPAPLTTARDALVAAGLAVRPRVAANALQAGSPASPDRGGDCTDSKGRAGGGTWWPHPAQDPAALLDP